MKLTIFQRIKAWWEKDSRDPWVEAGIEVAKGILEGTIILPKTPEERIEELERKVAGHEAWLNKWLGKPKDETN